MAWFVGEMVAAAVETAAEVVPAYESEVAFRINSSINELFALYG